MKMKLSLVVAAVWLLAAAGCHKEPSHRERETPPDWLVDYIGRLHAEVRRVDPTNGIDADEAKAIAGVYFVQNISGCGGPDDAVLHGDRWIVSLREGYVGKRSDRTIEVHAKTGGVWSAGEPRFASFDSFHYTTLIQVARDGH